MTSCPLSSSSPVAPVAHHPVRRGIFFARRYSPSTRRRHSAHNVARASGKGMKPMLLPPQLGCWMVAPCCRIRYSRRAPVADRSRRPAPTGSRRRRRQTARDADSVRTIATPKGARVEVRPASGAGRAAICMSGEPANTLHPSG